MPRALGWPAPPPRQQQRERRPEGCPTQSPPRPAPPGQAKVGDLRSEPAPVDARALEQHVGGLQVAVDNAHAVEVRHAAGDLEQRQQQRRQVDAQWLALAARARAPRARRAARVERAHERAAGGVQAEQRGVRVRERAAGGGGVVERGQAEDVVFHGVGQVAQVAVLDDLGSGRGRGGFGLRGESRGEGRVLGPKSRWRSDRGAGGVVAVRSGRQKLKRRPAG
jgi:hypothetical protein